MLFFTRNTEKNPLIIFPNKMMENLKEHAFVKVIFVLYRSVFQFLNFSVLVSLLQCCEKVNAV